MKTFIHTIKALIFKKEKVKSNFHIKQNELWKPFLFTLLVCFLFANTLKAQCPIEQRDFCEVTPSFQSKISITNAGYWRVITANGIPNHNIGIFPLAGRDCGRPSSLKEQNYTFVIPAFSSIGVLWPDKVFKIPKPPFYDKPQTTFGVAVNGVPFDPIAAEWWDVDAHSISSEPTGWNINPLRNHLMGADLDCNNGHVQPNGAYHYHGFPYVLYDKISREQRAAMIAQGDSESIKQEIFKVVQLGWAYDGNPIYGEYCGVKRTKRITAGLINAKSSYELRTDKTDPAARTDADLTNPLVSVFPLGDFVEDFWYNSDLFEEDKTVQLDECNGHRGYTPEFPKRGVYHYHILEKTNSLADIGFPYIGRCYRLFTYGMGPNIFPKSR